ncbi:MAG: hypothetical protein IJ917_04040 [Firmicutes bacterium]|nr:hypothetical protein [Bacillota bacterium]
MKYILQIFTGPWRGAHSAAEEIIRKIESVSARIPVGSVIIGWNTDASLYQEVGAFLHSAGIRILLWLPVFAEISGITEPETAVDLFGDPIVAPIHQEGEDFLFCCPSSPRNLQAVKTIYETYFGGCSFDGVFLDKIRSQSFVAGVSGVLSCGCPAAEGSTNRRDWIRISSQNGIRCKKMLSSIWPGILWMERFS